MNFLGLAIGISTFLIIGIFHPIVIKTEYYTGVRFWWVFLLVGLACIIGSLYVENSLLSADIGVIGFSSLWSILELFEQKERVNKGWFPAGPGHQK